MTGAGIGRLVAAAMLLASPQPAPAQARWVGTYDGGQAELAAGLELRADGRFRYALSYGALDEEATGRWRAEDGRVVLTGDPVTPPRFVALAPRALPAGGVRIELDVPDGMSRQWFEAELRRADGSVEERQLPEAGALAIAPDERAVAVTLTLPLFGLRSEAAAPKTGQAIRFRFEPHDLGRVAFAGTPLRADGADLLLARHDRLIRFRRQNSVVSP